MPFNITITLSNFFRFDQESSKPGKGLGPPSKRAHGEDPVHPDFVETNCAHSKEVILPFIFDT
jgi:hypothetical protein